MNLIELKVQQTKQLIFMFILAFVTDLKQKIKTICCTQLHTFVYYDLNIEKLESFLDIFDTSLIGLRRI